MENPKKTPLHSFHKSSGARLVTFAGWEMPIQYNSIMQEHLATRESAGLFDVSHMGEIFVTGKEEHVLQFLERLTPNHISTMALGQVRYNVILNEEGGLVDDVTIYRLQKNRFLICSNAANYDNVFSRLQEAKQDLAVEVYNESDKWHQIAIQGPRAEEIFTDLLQEEVASVKYFWSGYRKFQGEEILISRTGYTGEDGFEIYSSQEAGIELWTKLLHAGKDKGLVAVGLGARDTLRMEAKYPLYGNELTSKRTPVESGLSWIVKEKEIPYCAYDKIIAQKKQGSAYTISGIRLEEAGVIRDGYKVYNLEKEEIGVVTSGSYSPSLKCGIGLVYIQKEAVKKDLDVYVEIRGNHKKAVMIPGKFIQGSVKTNKK